MTELSNDLLLIDIIFILGFCSQIRNHRYDNGNSVHKAKHQKFSLFKDII